MRHVLHSVVFGNMVWKCGFGVVINVSPVYFADYSVVLNLYIWLLSLLGIIWLAQSVLLQYFGRRAYVMLFLP